MELPYFDAPDLYGWHLYDFLTILGFTVAFFLLLLALVVVLMERSNRHREV